MHDYHSYMAGDTINNASKIALSIIELITGVTVNTIKCAAEGKSKDAANVIAKHMKNGGGIISEYVNNSQADLFASLLNKANIPFIAQEGVDGTTGKRCTIFIFRDCDTPLVNETKEQMIDELSKQISETELSDFIEENKYASVNKIVLNSPDFEIFKDNLIEQKINYSVNPTADGYEIYYPENMREQVDKAMRGFSYDLIKNKAILNNIEETTAANNIFKNSISFTDPTRCIVDSNSPNRFILIDADGYSLHEIELNRDNDTINPTDKVIERGSNTDIEGLRKAVNDLYMPTIINADKHALIASINPDQSINTSKRRDLLLSYINFKNNIKNAAIKLKPVTVDRRADNQYKIYHNLPDDKLSLIKNILHDSVSLGSSVAVSKDYEEELNHILFDNLSKEDLLEKKYEYLGYGKLNLNTKEEQYIINTEAPGYTFILCNNHFLIAKEEEKREIIGDYDLSNQTYRDMVYDQLLSMPGPVVLNKDEYDRLIDGDADVLINRMSNNINMAINKEIVSHTTKIRDDFINNKEIDKNIEGQAKGIYNIIRSKEIKVENTASLIEKLTGEDIKTTKEYSKEQDISNNSYDMDFGM